MIKAGTRVRCELESRGRTVEVEGRVVRLQGTRFADVALGLGGSEITLPMTDLEPISAEVIPLGARVADRFWLLPEGGAV